MTNCFKSIRKSGFAHTLLLPLLTNLMVFGQPVEQILNKHKLSLKLNTSSSQSIIKPAGKDHSGNRVANNLVNYTKLQFNNTTAETATIFYAKETQGKIGKPGVNQYESINDNFFNVEIPAGVNMAKYDAILVYDLFGLADASQTTKSLNNHAAYGGKLLKTTATWSTVKENIPFEQLKPGVNEIFFNRRINEDYSYNVKNLRIELKLKTDSKIVLTNDKLVSYNGNVYLSGYVKDNSVTSVNVLGNTIPVVNGVFEKVIPNVIEGTTQITISCSGGSITVPAVHSTENASHHFEDKTADTPSAIFDLNTLTGNVNHYSITLSALKSKTETTGSIAVRGLNFKDVKTVNTDLDNVTEGVYSAYKVNKINIADSIGIELHLKYDPEKIPGGYTAKDVRPFYFDKDQMSWKTIKVDSLDTKNKEIIFTTYFNDTDYINGVIKVPESPETGNFSPTTISDMKYADPAAGVVAIQPPSPNSTGTVSTSFPIKLPPGRNGMQPSLSINYNSEGGNGWMGLGWNISTPAITLNTKWGAPLFGINETELYSLNGSDLVLKHNDEYTNPHRIQQNTVIPRQSGSESERIFYERKEGAYQKIIRHGNSPVNYWWEVIDKAGNKSFYGGYNGVDPQCVLSASETGGNIGHWALKRMEDPFGNSIEYIYSKTSGTVSNSAVTAQEFYISKIKYTMHIAVNSHYEVDFIRNESADRKDIILNARNGYIQIIDDLLTEIKVSFVNNSNVEAIRSYKFDYKDMPLQKKQLERISEYDSADRLFYSNTIEYFDEIGSGAIINSVTKSVNALGGDDDTVSAPMPAFGQLKGSPFGTSTAVGFSAGVRPGVGIGVNSTTVNSTLGASFNYSYSDQKTKISFLDINGDGLPDKIYDDGSNIYYRANTGNITDTLLFGNRSRLGTSRRLLRSKSRTVGGGVDANLMGIVGVGYSRSVTRTETDNYFADFNGDGLPDMVSGGLVHFNSGSGNQLTRNFLNTSASTENPISIGGMNIGALLNDIRLQTMDELREDHPQFDHVKVWQAPYTGTITINSTAFLRAKNSYNGKENKFKVTVEKAYVGQVSDTTSVLASYVLENINTGSSGTVINLNNLTINKGDLFFFRIHNLNYGFGGEIEWNPKITYTATAQSWPLLTRDDNRKNMKVYDAVQDHIMNNGSDFVISSHDQGATLNFNLIPSTTYVAGQFSNNFDLIIERKRIKNEDGSLISSEIFRRSYNASNNSHTFPDSYAVSPPAEGFTDFYNFRAESTSNISWDEINWKPSITRGTETIYPSVNYIIYDDNVYQKKYWVDGSDLPYPLSTETPTNIFIRVSHNALTRGYNVGGIYGYLRQFRIEEFPLKLNFQAKMEIFDPVTSTTQISRVGDETLYIHYLGVISESEGYNYRITTSPDINSPQITPITNRPFANISVQNIKKIIDNSGKIYAAIYVNDKKIALENDTSLIFTIHDKLATRYPTFNPIILETPFFATNPGLFGYTYRGWSQFLYNGGLGFQRNQDDEIINTTPTIYGDAPINMSVFDYTSRINALNGLGSNPEPQQVQNIGERVVRYTNYEQQNYALQGVERQKYLNKAIINANIEPERITSSYGVRNNNNRLTAILGRFGEGNIHELYISPESLISGETNAYPGMKQFAESRGDALTGNVVGVAHTNSNAKSTILNQYVDLNGDRYPDIVSKNTIQYTGMSGSYNRYEINHAKFTSGDKSKDLTTGITVAPMKPNSTQSDNQSVKGSKTVTNISAGINQNDGKSFDSKLWIDMNGDGLADMVQMNGENVDVNLNTGYGFTDKILWGSFAGTELETHLRSSGAFSGAIATASFAFGLGMATSTSKLKTSLVDVNGDQLPDLVVQQNGYKYHLNTGNGFLNTSLPLHGNWDDIIDSDESRSGNTFGAYTYGFSVPVVFIKFVFSASIGVNASFSRKTITFQDIDGDGYPDVLSSRSGHSSSLNINLNKMGKTHLLKKVNTPLGGSWTVDYMRAGNTYNLPQNKWVMSEIYTHDGFTADNTYRPDVTSTTVKYENPKYDRRERDFFGFEKITIQQRDQQNAIYRYQVKTYHNSNYYLSGALKLTQLYTASGELLNEERTLYNLLNPDAPVVNMIANENNKYLQAGLQQTLLDKSRLFVAVAKTGTITYEGDVAMVHHRDFTAYDSFGNLKTYIDNGVNAQDTYRTEINYHTGVSGIENGTGFPSDISVFNNADNTLFRHRQAQYEIGKLTNIMTKLSDADNYNVVNFSYDQFGNLIQIEQPDNLSEDGSEGYIKTIQYTDMTATYPTIVNNSFGEGSTTIYNQHFGIPVHTWDINDKQMRTRIDNRGRVVEVTGPNEIEAESTQQSPAWTIRMQYPGEPQITEPPVNDIFEAQGSFSAVTPGAAQPTTKQYTARTRHFDPEYPNATPSDELITVSIVDGFGQPIQVKKKLFANGMMKWLVSGFDSKDAFGRTLVTRLTAAQNAGSNDYSYYNVSVPDQVTMEYDERDRVRTITQRGETTSAEIDYAIDGNLLVQTVTNELNQTMATFTDIKGRQVRTVQNDEITTGFEYNAINELIRVINNEGYVTHYKYDLAGRTTESHHPDRGVVKFTYDNAGRLISQSNSKMLIAGDETIEYNYDHARLIGVNYPQYPQNNVRYTYGKPSDNVSGSLNAIGRLMYQEDASGVQVFKYGNMGEVIVNLRSLAVAGYQPYWFITRWQYDSWNRVQEIIYPDEEKISYEYNKAGMLKSINSELRYISASENQNVVQSITYDDYGDRKEITYGNGTKNTYSYDLRRRLNIMQHAFTDFGITKSYDYDPLSNIVGITTEDAGNSMPNHPGQIGGPVNHLYNYDGYNRLIHAEGNYTGATDINSSDQHLKQSYILDMEYNTNHTIKKKIQSHKQGLVGASSSPEEYAVHKTNYTLDYDGYGTASHTAGSYSYNQPHAVRKIVERPTTGTELSATDPQVRHKEIVYDANGNQAELKETVGNLVTSLRKNLWDEENRLIAVDLKPDDTSMHPIAVYTYDAAGQRAIRYNYDHIDVYSNGEEMAQSRQESIMLYPNGLIMGKAIHGKDYLNDPVNSVEYTKHYYVGSERVGSKTGTIDWRNTKYIFGNFPHRHVSENMGNLSIQETMQKGVDRLTAAQTLMGTIFTALGQQVPAFNNIPVPEQGLSEDIPHEASKLNMYYFHPDHLGSSSYISNKEGKVSQHMEYLPFGETLVDEHINSNNSPFKFNGKEYDEETGNYYYSARYYDPKLSIFISVDPLVEKTMDAYGYCYQNPVKLVDPTGMSAEEGDGWVKQGNNLIYDANINDNSAAEKKYGNGAIVVGYGSSVEHISGLVSYTLGYDGIVTGRDGEEIDVSKGLTTVGGGFNISIAPNEVADVDPNQVRADAIKPTVPKLIETIGTVGGIAESVKDSKVGTFLRNGRAASESISKVLKVGGGVAGAYGLINSYNEFRNGKIGAGEYMVDTVMGAAGFFPPVGSIASMSYSAFKTIYEYSTGTTLFPKPTQRPLTP